MHDERTADPLVHRGHWLELDPRLTYGLAQVRYEVYTMGQGITSEQDLDGRDLDPGTTIYWIQDDAGRPVSTLRTLREEGQDGVVIGRVATSPAHRGRGLAGLLLRAVLAEHPGERISMHAQAHLREWYGRFGFLPEGEPFREAGIPHLPLTREPTAG